MALRHRTAIAIAAALVAASTAAGCSAVSTAMDCANTAVAISNSVDDLQQAVSDAADNPADAQDALNRIDKNLDKLGDQTGNADLGKAVDDMSAGVDSVRKAIDQGRTPDITPVTNAAGELTKVCSPS